ncbi:MAG: ZIP family metal transporter [Oscillospiraceae bacterium]|nr:ZIP family metal transporter [Oscillospiraceae bacterium]MCI9309171.1 ZIP family metal transporter [Oscillospiraceae bacterium]MCI9548690.1 ZIP family metal transporter [Oscillospiraceae bacterium]
MDPILFVVCLTAATGVGGLALGGVLAALFKRESPRGTSLLLSFTAGLMLAIVALDMVPEAVEAAPWRPMAPLTLVGGFVVTYLLNCWIDKSAHHEDAGDPHQCACGHHDLHTAGLVLAAAVALHNVPVGMAVGAAVAVEGICLASVLAAVTIGLHNLPEGMSIAIPLLHDGSRTWSAIGVAALSGLPTVAGALAGYFVGSEAPAALAAALSLAGGAMLYVVFFELLPEASLQWRSRWSILATVVGFALGVLLIFGHGHH